MQCLKMIKKRLKAHDFFESVIVGFLMAAGLLNRHLAREVRTYLIYKKLEKRYQRFIGKCEKEAQEPKKRDYVWICWLQGMENAPSIVQECYNSVCYWLREKEIVVVTAANYMDYVNIPNNIIVKWSLGTISNTHFSDILRLELLIRYGGLWLDATSFFTGELPQYVTRESFFVFRNGWMDREILHIGSWLMYSEKTNDILLLETRALLYRYWEKNNYLKHYFLLHMFFQMVTEQYQQLWWRVPYVNHLENHYLAHELLKPLNDDRIREIKTMTTVHKLTYKVSKRHSGDMTIDYLPKIWPEKRSI